MTLRDMLKIHEGKVLNQLGDHVLYPDLVKKLTIGYGHNIEDNGIPEHIAEALLEYDISVARSDLRKVFINFGMYSEARQEALTNMMFNLGYHRFTGFVKMIAAILRDDWQEAKVQALDSKWHRQVGQRAKEIAHVLEMG